jgi:2-keto-4-pentenoate hydratase/2-oxohepta-3-ene-1,7-dioic acid hydratase in catechol pathway
VVLAEEASGPGADVLRQAVANGVDLGGAGTGRLGVAELRPLAPLVNPSKLLAIGLNYADHAAETGAELPKEPVVFVKTTNAICGPGDDIRLPPAAPDEVDYEAELAVVIGRRASDVSVADALDYVLGYTCCNDVSARDAQFSGGQWVRGKSFDTFAPLGPVLVTTDDIPDPQSLAVRCVVDGRALQDGTTKDMVFGVAELIAYISRGITLEPGDVISTGTPAGVGFSRNPPVFLRAGSSVTVEIEGIGELTNSVVAVT